MVFTERLFVGRCKIGKSRKILFFFYKKYEEIAIELNISVNTVKYHMKKALSCLQQRMEKYLKLLVLYVFLGN